MTQVINETENITNGFNFLLTLLKRNLKQSVDIV